VILPLYYRSEKQDFRGLVNYLNIQLRDGDMIFVNTLTYIPGILHYFKVYPQNRHYKIPFSWKKPGKEFEFRASLISEDRGFTILHSNIPYPQYVGSFANFRRFPSDASMYLFLWDPRSPGEKGIDMRID
jgi:hypothetical protein